MRISFRKLQSTMIYMRVKYGLKIKKKSKTYGRTSKMKSESWRKPFKSLIIKYHHWEKKLQRRKIKDKPINNRYKKSDVKMNTFRENWPNIKMIWSKEKCPFKTIQQFKNIRKLKTLGINGKNKLIIFVNLLLHFNNKWNNLRKSWLRKFQISEPSIVKQLTFWKKILWNYSISRKMKSQSWRQIKKCSKNMDKDWMKW